MSDHMTRSKVSARQVRLSKKLKAVCDSELSPSAPAFVPGAAGMSKDINEQNVKDEDDTKCREENEEVEMKAIVEPENMHESLPSNHDSNDEGRGGPVGPAPTDPLNSNKQVDSGKQLFDEIVAPCDDLRRGLPAPSWLRD